MSFSSDYPHLHIIREIARRKKVSVYLVGGFLRDLILGSPKTDFDFAVEKDALGMAKAFSRKIKGAFVLLDEERGCARVAKKVDGGLMTFDFADFRASTFEQDLAHRDFTINTLSLDLSKLTEKSDLLEMVTDLKRGLKDIKERRIKRTSVRIFQEDPLRMMRAFSLQASLGFKIELKTLNLIRKEKDLLNGVSPERVRDELFKILDTDHAARILKSMDRVGLLEKVMPQIRVMRHCPQGTYHHLDVWPHSLETVVQLEKIFERFAENPDITGYINVDLGGHRTRKSLLKLGALLHDIGKPDTRKTEKGRVSFHGHEHVGMRIVRHIANMLKLSIRERHALEDMVRWHLRPGYLSNFKQPSEKAIYRFFRDAKDEGAGILLLSMADQKSTRGPATTQNDQKHHEAICRDLLERYFEKQKEQPFIRLINGNDLIQELKLKPSPLFGKILLEIEEQQTLGTIQTKKDALDRAKIIAKLT